MAEPHVSPTWEPPGQEPGGTLDAADRALAFANIRRAASYFDVDMTEQSWHDLMH